MYYAFEVRYPLRTENLISEVEVYPAPTREPGRFEKVRAKWDTGANHTVISTSLRERLNLIPIEGDIPALIVYRYFRLFQLGFFRRFGVFFIHRIHSVFEAAQQYLAVAGFVRFQRIKNKGIAYIRIILVNMRIILQQV